MNQVTVPLLASPPILLQARTWWASLRLACHAALGSLVATGADLGNLWRLTPVHLVFALGGMVAVALLAYPSLRARAGGFLLVLGSVVLLLQARVPGLLLALYGGAVFLGLSLSWPLPRLMPGSPWRAAAFGLGHGVLPFLAGYAASGHRPGGSAWLLALGFFALCLGGYPYLRRGAWSRATAPVWFDRLALCGLIGGVAAMGVWLLTYGPGLSGLLLATPSALWLLWLAAGGAHRPAHAAWHPRRQALGAWVTLQIAIALAAYF